MSLFMKTEKGKQLRVTRCQNCGKIYFPVRKNCPDCIDTGIVEDIPLSQRGKLYTYSITYIKPLVKGIVSPPYANGILEFPEGFKMFAILIDVEPLTDEAMQQRIGKEFEIVSDANICTKCKSRYFPAVTQCPKCGPDGQLQEMKNNYFAFRPVESKEVS
ncbi:MAG: Zn-ribbon domain-containing OB-fold protein [Candidatus Helarchaeota archaeon]